MTDFRIITSFNEFVTLSRGKVNITGLGPKYDYELLTKNDGKILFQDGMLRADAQALKNVINWIEQI